MTKAEELYHQIAETLPNTIKGKMFGALCVKNEKNNKAGVMFWKDYMVFKLPEEQLNDALAMDGIQMFSPMGGDKFMNGWVQVPYDYKDNWQEWAEKSMDFVALIEPKPKKKKK
jgi:hypothetical protein